LTISTMIGYRERAAGDCLQEQQELARANDVETLLTKTRGRQRRVPDP
jgi:hypothetical protein